MNGKIKKIGVLTSGGDAPGMNAAIRAVARTCIYHGIECVGVRRGYKGLIDADFVPLRGVDVSGIISLGGTILYTARSKEFMTEEGLAKAVKNCREQGIDGLVTIGGDGTFRGALSLSKNGISVVGIPATIDNDIACTDYTIGFDTACNTAIECIDKLRDTMASHERCSIVEVMGRHAGYIALAVGIAAGASAVIVPEIPCDFENDIVYPIFEGLKKGRTNFNVIVAEGAGSVNEIAEMVQNRTGIDTRFTILGHVQRGGSPLGRDRIIASILGGNAVDVLAEGKTNRVVCVRDDKYTDMDIEEALKMTKNIDEEMWELLKKTKMR